MEAEASSTSKSEEPLNLSFFSKGKHKNLQPEEQSTQSNKKGKEKIDDRNDVPSSPHEGAPKKKIAGIAMGPVSDAKTKTFFSPFPNSTVATIPRYIVNLDDPPETRWNHIMAVYKDAIREVERSIQNVIREIAGNTLGAILESVLTGISSTATHMGAIYYGEELKGMSKALDMSVGRLAFIQLAYEAASCCTSIIVPTANNIPVHIRSMDWDMTFLEPLTIEVDFTRGGQIVYQATTWAGYVGVLTGVRTTNLIPRETVKDEDMRYDPAQDVEGYSVAVNFRLTGDSWFQNLKKMIGRSWPVSFLLRVVFDTETTYKGAVEALKHSSLIAPCYFTVCGTKPLEGCLITRRRDTEEQFWDLAEGGFIVQTNIDHWSSKAENNILWSIERRMLVRTLLGGMQNPAEITEEELWEIMSRKPVLNEETIYATFMVPRVGLMKTRLPRKGGLGFRPAPEVKHIISD